MKKLLLFSLLSLLVAVTSCSDQDIARNWGGEATIILPKGEKLIEATWKDQSDLWYLTEPMKPGYEPQVKIFRESSSYSGFDGTVKFIEQR